MLRNLKQFKLPEIEEKVLKFWKENQVFEKSLKLRSFSNAQDKQAQGKKPFRFFEGPPTANGRPGIHHVLARVFKDVILRYKTMRGYFVRRKAGWDTHGLPIEIEVEKELGLKNKQEIEKFGIAEFNEKAKLSVWKYQDEWEKLTDRIGFWLDLKNPYITYKPDYIESLWWVFKQIANRGLLKRSFKIVPYCPRCQTPLSTHEMGQPEVYRKVKDPSIWVKFKVESGKGKAKSNEFLLVWTTTPWTLPSNVAIAINPSLTYTKYSAKGGPASGGKIEYIWSYSFPPAIDNVEYEIVEKISGKKLIGLRYKPLFNIKGPWLKNKKFFKVYGADFVSTEEGTGLVHIAPAFGEDDMNLIKKYQKELVGQIPITIDEKGIVQKGIPGAGKPAKIADKDIVQDLERRGILLKSDTIEHDYPFCWRCNTALLYFSQFSWFIEMSRLQKELISNNQKINWVPEHIKEGRFGEWLREIKDWAISRNRYWGTPLPIWICESQHVKKGCGHIEVIGGLADLDKMRFSGNRFFLMRHGEGDHMFKNVIASGPERGDHVAYLTEKGKKEIEAEIKVFIKRLGKEKLDYIYSSPYIRTKQTAEIAAKLAKAKIIIDNRLSEVNAGIFNWRPPKEFHDFFDKDLEIFTKTPPGGENHNEIKKRMTEAVLEINSKYKNKNILIVSHGNPLWMLEGALRGLTNKEILKMDYKYKDVNDGVREVKVHNWPYNAEGELDLHRPCVDNIFLKCPKCGGKMSRVKEVADVWFDSGCMPFAQFHYPFNCPKAQSLEECVDFPADYISEGIDQTRGWFYTLLAVSTALGLDMPPYLNVVASGLVLDKFGQKMSKSKGNVVNPWDMIQKYGADILRWYFYTINAPGEPKQFDEADLAKMFRKFIMIIYNSFVFFDTYAEKSSVISHQSSVKNVLDRWILARLNEVILKTTEKLDVYDIGGTGKEIEIFVDDLSRWYIRRSRSRFQKPADMEDFKSASFTLHYCLLELSKLIAPFTPFFAEALYQSCQMSDVRCQVSIHLEDWPKADKEKIDYSLLKKMEEVRKISSLALALRAEKGIKVRQPLKTLEIKSNTLDVRDEEFIKILKDEVNVKEVKWNLQMKEDVIFDTAITAELREEGLLRDAVRMVQGLRHDANYVPKDKIVLMIEVDPDLRSIFDKNADLLKKEVNAEDLSLKRSEKFDAELDSKIDGHKIWIGVRKI